MQFVGAACKTVRRLSLKQQDVNIPCRLLTRGAAEFVSGDFCMQFIARRIPAVLCIAHPREEHLIPLMVAAGAAGSDRATLAFNGTFGGTRLSAFHFD